MITKKNRIRIKVTLRNKLMMSLLTKFIRELGLRAFCVEIPKRFIESAISLC